MKRFAFPVRFSALDAASALYSEPYFVWLDSSRPDHPQGRYSYIAFAPLASPPPKSSSLKGTGFTGLDGGDNFPPFQGGLIGFKTYEGQSHFKYYNQLLSFDHQTGQGWFVTNCNNESEAHRHYEDICTKIRTARPMPEYQDIAPAFVSNFTAEAYKKAVAEIIEHILDGDIFQANLSQQFRAPRPRNFNPFMHYLKLRDINPAPFSAYLDWGELQIASASPESFLDITSGGKMTTRPIKGTDSHAERLMSSAKDRAENIMIVDLLRNDLSRVATDESVIVTKLCELQSFSGLHHLVSEITAQMQTDKTAEDVLQSCFPGGSITGAPKIKAVEILKNIERIPRGIYCGAIGWVGDDGAMETSLAIRTVVTTADTISFGVGGGITARSDPAAEYNETLLKADRIFKSFGVHP